MARLRGVADEDAARLGDRLDAARRVDHVAGDHALAVGAEVTVASPVSTPARAIRSAAPISSPERRRRPRRARAPRGRRARRRPRGRSGAPQTAMTASPMNFSTVPP